MSERTVNVPAISCEHCTRTIEREVGEIPGVTRVRADLRSKKVTVAWDDAAADWAVIRDLMHEIHYPPEE